MSIKQVSLFVESRPGHLKRNLELLREGGVSLRGYMCSDTGDYGIARFIVDDPDRALALFADHGCAVTASEIVCLELEDEPGALARVFDVIAQTGMNISYSYSLISTYIAFKVSDAEKAEAVLRENGYSPLSQDDLK